jgi:hypothetical protein
MASLDRRDIYTWNDMQLNRQKTYVIFPQQDIPAPGQMEFKFDL